MRELNFAYICLILAMNAFASEALRMRPPLHVKSQMRATSSKFSESITITLSTTMGMSLVFPRVVEAVTSSKAEEALQLLDGYQTRTDPNVTWAVLLAGSAWLLFEIYKGLANW
jgi:hypothetical protein